MKTLRLIGTAVAAVVLSVGLVGCSDDDDDQVSPMANDILGLWECVESDSEDIYAFEPGDMLKFFEGEFDESQYIEGGQLKGRKCLYGRNGDFNVDGDYDANGPTETQWNQEVAKYQGNGDEYYLSFPEIYTLDGSSLSVIACDYDRRVGTITIDGDVMTFTYMYQDWRVISNPGGAIMEEEIGPFTSKFQKK